MSDSGWRLSESYEFPVHMWGLDLLLMWKLVTLHDVLRVPFKDPAKHQGFSRCQSRWFTVAAQARNLFSTIFKRASCGETECFWWAVLLLLSGWRSVDGVGITTCFENGFSQPHWICQFLRSMPSICTPSSWGPSDPTEPLQHWIPTSAAEINMPNCRRWL